MAPAFPMLLIPLSTLLDRKRLPELLPCQELLRQGHLVFYDAEIHKFIVFVSHQWLGFHHPDPDGLQFKALRDCLQKLVEGHVVAEEWSDVLIFGSDTTSEGYYHLKADTTYIWLDWFCIPQVGKALGLPSSGVLCSSEPYEAV